MKRDQVESLPIYKHLSLFVLLQIPTDQVGTERCGIAITLQVNAHLFQFLHHEGGEDVAHVLFQSDKCCLFHDVCSLFVCFGFGLLAEEALLITDGGGARLTAEFRDKIGIVVVPAPTANVNQGKPLPEKQAGVFHALETYCGVSADAPMAKVIKDYYEKIQAKTPISEIIA